MGKKTRLKQQKAAATVSAKEYLKQPKSKQALDEEIRKFLKEQYRFVYENNLAAALWTMHEVFGFGKIRLNRYIDKYDKLVEELLQKYQMFDSSQDIDFLARRELLKMGIDVSKLISEKDLF